MAERKFEYFQQLKKEQESIICEIVNNNGWWDHNIDKDYSYLTEGGEAKIYLSGNGYEVIKLNDAVYYNTWLDFLNSILLHNYYFESTRYTLVGFININGILYASLKQPYVIANAVTNTLSIKVHLEENGFLLKKRYDYWNPSLGIHLEDIHDENVLTCNSTLFFIDTFFSL